MTRHFLDVVVIDVTDQTVARLFCRVVHAVGADVDDDDAGLTPILLDHLRASGGGDDDVRLSAHALRILRLRVHHGHRAIFLHQQQRRRHAHDVRTSDDDGVLPGQLHAAPLQEFDAPLGRARREQRFVSLHRQFTDIFRVKPIDILLKRDLRQHSLLVHVFRKRQLHQYPVHLRVGVKLSHRLEHLSLGRRLRDLRVKTRDPRLFARLALHSHVRLRVLALTDDHHRQSRRLPVGASELGHLVLDLTSDRRRDRLTVDDGPLRARSGPHGRPRSVVERHGASGAE